MEDTYHCLAAYLQILQGRCSQVFVASKLLLLVAVLAHQM